MSQIWFPSLSQAKFSDWTEQYLWRCDVDAFSVYVRRPQALPWAHHHQMCWDEEAGRHSWGGTHIHAQTHTHMHTYTHLQTCKYTGKLNIHYLLMLILKTWSPMDLHCSTWINVLLTITCTCCFLSPLSHTWCVFLCVCVCVSPSVGGFTAVQC